MKATWPTIIGYVLGSEGGFVNDPQDPGGMTDHGLTARTLKEWTGRTYTAAAMRAMSLSEVRDLYRVHMWRPVRGDELPAGLDYVVFDEVVNSGEHQAVVQLQRLLGVTADGRIGMGTMAAVASLRDVPAFIRRYDAARLTFMRKLKVWVRYGRGWRARVDLVTNRAVLLALRTPCARSTV